jgi:PhnB protein
MAKASKPIPEGMHTVTPHLIIKDASKAIDFYKQAFGAEERFRMNSPDGRVAHAELQIGDSIIFLSDEFPEMGRGRLSPQSLGGTCAALNIYTENVDSAFEKAVNAGAQAAMPVMDMFWGDRYGQLVDPFGHVWSVAQHKEDLTPQEIESRAKEFYAKMGKPMQKTA